MAEAALAPTRIAAARRMRFRLDWGGTLGVVLTAAVVFIAASGPGLAPHDPLEQTLEARLRPPAFAGGPQAHWLGTDNLGRDILSRVLAGARPSLAVGLSALVFAAVVGVPTGLASGYYRGRFDKIVMRLADIQLAFPAILLALAILAVAGPSNLNLIAVLALSLWVIFARVVRGEVLSLRQREFIGAAVAMGAGDLRIFRRHVLPNLAGTLLVLASVSLTRVILAEAALSFLGMGIQPPTPTWGGMISDGRAYLAVAWWVATMPGLALTLAVIGFNLLGDYLRDRIDPRLRS